METIFLTTTFILGTIIGSFLNVVVFRYNTGRSVGGRSACMTCSKILEWQNLIPVFSFIAQSGKCANCKAKISVQYPIVEVLTGSVFMLVANKVGFNFLPLLFYLAIFSILTVIAVYDYKHKIIPDGLVFAFIGLAFAKLLYGMFLGDFGSWNNLVSAVVIFIFFASLWFISRGRWMGFGDAKLVLGIGFLLPFCANVSAIVLSFFSGSIIGIIAIVFSKLCSRVCGKKFTFDHEMPFAPFIIFSTLAVFAFNFDVINLLTQGSISCVLF